jgi:serine/threonine protein phosphatase 1
MISEATRAAATGERRRAAVPAGCRIYAVGDIHGRLDLLTALTVTIVADAREGAPSRRRIVYLGDYVDRGLWSREVIDHLLAGPLPEFEAIHLLGNHESMMREFLDDTGVGPTWMMNGGDRTLSSYGVAADDALWAPRSAFEHLQAAFRARLPRAHRKFLESLRLMHIEGDYAFVHAGVRPGVALDRQVEEDLIWIREPFLSSIEDFGKIVVHGHTIAPRPDMQPNRIGIDTGAYSSNRLTCLVLEGDKRRFLST